MARRAVNISQLWTAHPPPALGPLQRRACSGSSGASGKILAHASASSRAGGAGSGPGPAMPPLVLGGGLVLAAGCGMAVAAYNGFTDRMCENQILEVRVPRAVAPSLASGARCAQHCAC